MPRLTGYFDLDMTQGSVDFVDVDVDGDVPVYIDPTAIRHQAGIWAEACVASLQSFFGCLISAIKADDRTRLEDLIFPLVEPNETHLGNSQGQPRGRSLGSRVKADELISTLRKSKAVESGFLRDLEDSALMVEGIDKDIISDITTCVIRRQLIEYTQQQCNFHGISMDLQESGPIWDIGVERWVTDVVELPRASDNKLLLVPKSIVRARLTTDKGRYYRGYLRPYFEDEVLANPKVGLVRVLKNKTMKVILGALDAELGTSKPDIISNTEKHPEALDQYRGSLRSEDSGPFPDEILAERIGAEVENLRDLLGEMRSVSPGTAGANLYHRCVARLMTAIFNMSLGNQKIERCIHNGMKRIDITYDNIARHGFFDWLARHFQASTVVVECKNYGHDAGNPEFDQLAMRFAPNRGRFGILACRAFEDKERALARAKAIATDGNGFVIVLDDDDFERMVDDLEAAGRNFDRRLAYPLLRERWAALVD